MPTLQFKGRSTIWNHHLSVPYHALEEVRKLDYEPARGEGNLIVEGDNLLALKALLPQYAAKVKCIYIDPPYNTGNEGWAYNDKVNSPMIKDWLGRTVDKDDLTRHDKWLCMMVPRLKLLRELLREDGVIAIHIDEHEEHHLRNLCEDIFGEENFLGNIVWDKQNPKGDAKAIGYQHEKIMLFAKNSEYLLSVSDLRREKPSASQILKKAEILFKKVSEIGLAKVSSEFKEWIKCQPFSGGERAYNRMDKNGDVYRGVSMAWPNKKKAPDQYFIPLIHPITKKECPIPERGWRNSPETMEDLLKKDLILFGEDERKQPERKYLLKENLVENIPSVISFGGSDDSLFKKWSLEFDNPKPYKFVKDFIKPFISENDLILDSFAGSGTAMHAVMALNKEDGGNRKCIMVQMTEAIEQAPDKNICRDITRERVKRAIEKYDFESGFKYLRVGASMDAEDMLAGQLPSYEQLAKYVFYLATGTYLEKPTLDRRIHYVGANSSSAVYLIYEPDIDKLTQMALTLDIAEEIIAHNKKRKLIYAPACFLDEEYMEEQQIDFVSVPYNLFERKAV